MVPVFFSESVPAESIVKLIERLSAPNSVPAVNAPSPVVNLNNDAVSYLCP